MPSPIPLVIGTASSAVSSATYVVTITTASPAGNTVIVAADASGTTAVTGVTDTQGNTYTVQAVNASGQFVSHFTSVSAAALATTDTITVTYGAANAQQKNIQVMSVAGLTAVDKKNNTTGTSTAPSNTISPLTAGLEVAVATFSYANAGGAITLGAGWTSVSTIHTGSNQFTVTAYQVTRLGTSGTPFVTASGTITSALWATLVTSFSIPLLSIPAVPTFPAGFGPVDSDMQGWITSSLGFCTQGIMLRVVQTASQSYTANTFSGNAISFDLVLEDPYTGWNAGSNQWQPPFSGWYELAMTASFSAAAGSVSGAFLVAGNRVEFNEIAMSSLNPSGITCVYIVYLIGNLDNVSCTVNPQGAGPYTSDVSAVGRRSSFEISFLAT